MLDDHRGSCDLHDHHCSSRHTCNMPNVRQVAGVSKVAIGWSQVCFICLGKSYTANRKGGRQWGYIVFRCRSSSLLRSKLCTWASPCFVQIEVATGCPVPRHGTSGQALTQTSFVVRTSWRRIVVPGRVSQSPRVFKWVGEEVPNVLQSARRAPSRSASPGDAVPWSLTWPFHVTTNIGMIKRWLH
jgi:hypothetical protein